MIYCSSCGQRPEPNMKFCPSCGQKLKNNVFCLDDLSNPPGDKGPRAGIIAVLIPDGAVQIPDGAVPKPGDMAVEKPELVYYADEKGLCITPSMLVVPGKTDHESPSTYSLHNITAVKSEKDISARIIGIVGAVFGIAVLAAQDFIPLAAAMAIGIILVVFGVMIAIFIRPTYHLKIAGEHGEVEALKMSRKQEFDSVMTAMNKALVNRG